MSSRKEGFKDKSWSPMWNERGSSSEGSDRLIARNPAFPSPNNRNPTSVIQDERLLPPSFPETPLPPLSNSPSGSHQSRSSGHSSPHRPPSSRRSGSHVDPGSAHPSPLALRPSPRSSSGVSPSSRHSNTRHPQTASNLAAATQPHEPAYSQPSQTSTHTGAHRSSHDVRSARAPPPSEPGRGTFRGWGRRPERRPTSIESVTQGIQDTSLYSTARESNPRERREQPEQLSSEGHKDLTKAEYARWSRANAKRNKGEALSKTESDNWKELNPRKNESDRIKLLNKEARGIRLSKKETTQLASLESNRRAGISDTQRSEEDARKESERRNDEARVNNQWAQDRILYERQIRGDQTEEGIRDLPWYDKLDQETRDAEYRSLQAFTRHVERGGNLRTGEQELHDRIKRIRREREDAKRKLGPNFHNLWEYPPHYQRTDVEEFGPEKALVKAVNRYREDLGLALLAEHAYVSHGPAIAAQSSERTEHLPAPSVQHLPQTSPFQTRGHRGREQESRLSETQNPPRPSDENLARTSAGNRLPWDNVEYYRRDDERRHGRAEALERARERYMELMDPSFEERSLRRGREDDSPRSGNSNQPSPSGQKPPSKKHRGRK